MASKTKLSFKEKILYMPIPGYERYLVSNWHGLILDTMNGTYLNSYMSSDKKYLLVSLYNDITKKWINMRLHRVVALAWRPNIDNKPTVNHKIASQTFNNSVNNLEWATYSEQAAGKIKPKQSQYFGVCKFRNKWQSKIRVKGKDVYIGMYHNEYDAAKAYDQYIKDNDLPNKLNF